MNIQGVHNVPSPLLFQQFTFNLFSVMALILKIDALTFKILTNIGRNLKPKI